VQHFRGYVPVSLGEQKFAERDALAAAGIILEDGSAGTTWRRA